MFLHDDWYKLFSYFRWKMRKHVFVFLLPLHCTFLTRWQIHQCVKSNFITFVCWKRKQLAILLDTINKNWVIRNSLSNNYVYYFRFIVHCTFILIIQIFRLQNDHTSYTWTICTIFDDLDQIRPILLNWISIISRWSLMNNIFQLEIALKKQ